MTLMNDRSILKKVCTFSLAAALLAAAGGWTAAPAQKTPVRSAKVLEKAAAENDALQYSLRWTFGRKEQKGWYLYVPLIKHTIGTDAAPGSEGFAAAVREWQQRRGLRADAIIDRTTLFDLIEFWQSRRIRPVVEASEETLLTVDIPNFYDPTRSLELRMVEKEAFRAYREMVRAAAADESLGLKTDKEGNLSEDEPFLKLISTYRSPAYQAELRKREPDAGRAQIAYVSPHFTGRALDIYVGGEPVSTKDYNRLIQIRHPVYGWLVRNAERFGFYPYFYEPWHWEYVGKE